MQSFLKYELKSQLDLFPKRAHNLRLLIGDEYDQQTITSWCKKRSLKSNLAAIFNIRDKPENVMPCEEWEARLIVLSWWFSSFFELSEWEALRKEERMKQAQRIARLARQLASAIDETAMYVPPALALFDEEQAAKIIEFLPHSSILLTSGDPAGDLCSFFGFPEPQQLPAILRRLASIAEERTTEPKRDKRPCSYHPNARAFARHLAEHFKSYYGRTPNEVIAACVCLKYPEIDPPPLGDTVRDWRGSK